MQPVIVARGPRILMVQYDGWRDYYETEKRNIEESVGELFLAIEHVGSTSVVGLVAKPVIDIIAATQSLEDGPAIAASLEPLGYRQIPFIPHRATLERLYFPKRSVNTPEGVDLEHPGYNIHVVRSIGSFRTNNSCSAITCGVIPTSPPNTRGSSAT
jgi:GrpB-like predicted nucleotidyltransferase (UPF0157 family)